MSEFPGLALERAAPELRPIEKEMQMSKFSSLDFRARLEKALHKIEFGNHRKGSPFAEFMAALGLVPPGYTKVEWTNFLFTRDSTGKRTDFDRYGLPLLTRSVANYFLGNHRTAAHIVDEIAAAIDKARAGRRELKLTSNNPCEAQGSKLALGQTSPYARPIEHRPVPVKPVLQTQKTALASAMREVKSSIIYSTAQAPGTLEAGIPCSCQGENINCFRCDGLGVYNLASDSQVPASSEGPTEGSKKSEVRTYNGRAANLTYREWAGLVELETIKNPVAPKKSVIPSTTVTRTTAKAPATTFVCLQCGLNAPTQLVLNEHVRRAHTQRKKQNPSRPSKARKAKPSATFKLGKGTLLQVSSKTQEMKPRSSTISRKTDAPLVGTKECQTPQKLDAKFGWGGSFRDHGAFGSYPSHDDMDDESMP